MVRLASGLVLAGVSLAAIWFLPPFALRLLACAVAALAALEDLRIVKGDPRLLVLVAAVCWLVSGASLLTGLATIPLVTLVVVAVAVLFGGHTPQQAAAGAFSMAYIGIPLGMLAVIQAVGGRQATLLLIATVVVSDSMQFYTGRLLGRRPLALAISPKKTVEGALGGVVFGSLFMATAGAWVFPDATRVSLAILGLVIVVLGIAGDLFESRLKRQANVKDSSTVIPGHGGVLDRIDALLFAIPAFFVFTALG